MTGDTLFDSSAQDFMSSQMQSIAILPKHRSRTNLIVIALNAMHALSFFS